MKKVILVIEDENLLRESLVTKLNLEGFSTLEAKNGEEGLDVALNKIPDLILVDIMMPKMDGLTMLQKLQQDGRCKNTKVIVLTNVDDIKKLSEVMENGVFDYLVKSDQKIEDIISKVKAKLS